MAGEWLTRQQNPWIIVLIAGICSTVFGLLVIFHPWEGAQALIYLVAIAFIIAGLANVFEDDERLPRSVTVLSGMIWVVAGAVILAWPEATLKVLAIIAGLGLVIRGILRAVVAFNDKTLHRNWYFIMAAIALLLGIAVIVRPEATITVVAFLIGINIFIAGVLEIALAFDIRTASRFH
jgi:uncharacterized membrane protein HdeD (DUF308 family)